MMMRYWTGDIALIEGKNAKYRRYRVHMAKRTEARLKGAGRVPEGLKVCHVLVDARRYTMPTISALHHKTKEAG